MLPTSRLLSTFTPRIIHQQALEKVYVPAFKGVLRNSPEYIALGKTGRVWEDYHRPYNVQPYLNYQNRPSTKNMLAKLQSIQTKRITDHEKIIRSISTDFAHQSCALEDNKITISEAYEARKHLDLFLMGLNLRTIGFSGLLKHGFPVVGLLENPHSADELIEIRNHVLSAETIVDLALAAPGTVGMSFGEMMDLHKTTVKDTAFEKALVTGMFFGKKSRPGTFRQLPIQVKSHPQRIFPYPLEIDALFDRFLKWRTEEHESKRLHPLLFATQQFVYFCHIHPFQDGNGRVGRSIMTDYLIRQGLLPVVFCELERGNYLGMVGKAQEEKPESLCEAVLEAQLRAWDN